VFTLVGWLLTTVILPDLPPSPVKSLFVIVLSNLFVVVSGSSKGLTCVSFIFSIVLNFSLCNALYFLQALPKAGLSFDSSATRLS
jgi:hypothetical protein